MSHPDRFLLAGVMGWPVMHSRSPMLHNHWFRQYDLAGSYVPLAIRPEGLGAALRALHPLGFAGVNLTIPHKQQALTIVDEVDTVARSIGAISCVVVRPDGSLAATNNDCWGFIENLRQEQPGWRPDAGPIVVIGAGGGSRAVCYGLAQEGAREIRLVNRTFARAKDIADEFGHRSRPSPGSSALTRSRARRWLSTPRAWAWSASPRSTSAWTSCRRAHRRRHRLHPARDAVSRGSTPARKPHRQRPGHAAEPGPAGLEGVVRPRTRSDGGVEEQ